MTVKTRTILVLGVLSLLALVSASPAFAAERAWWQLSSSTRPAYLQPGQEATIVVQATDLGDVAVNGSESPVTITDKLPSNVRAIAVSGHSSSNYGGSVRGEVSCSLLESGAEAGCSWAGPEPLQPYEQIEVVIGVKVEAAESGASNEVSIAGGQAYSCNKVEGTGRFLTPFCEVMGAYAGQGEASPPGTGNFEGEFGSAVPGVSLKRPVIVTGGPTPFGVEEYGIALENDGGSPDTQAGSHPFQFTTTLGLNQATLSSRPPALAKDLRFNLPPGLIGNPTVLPRCTEAEFSTLAGANANLCPDDTAIGVASITAEATGFSSFSNKPATYAVPIFNLVPAPGEPARFGFEIERIPVLIDTSIRTGGDYGIVASVHNITEVSNFISQRVTFWGVPGDSRHDRSRGWSCLAGGYWSGGELPPCTALGETQPPPFLTLPTSCTGQLETSVQADSWKDPTPLPPFSPSEPVESLDGCNRLPFGAEISVAPDVQSASTPTGLAVKVHVPQQASLDPTGLADADVRDTTVTLPEGVALNPAGADGLEACSNAEIGYLPGESEPPGRLRFTSGLPAPKEAPVEPFCPDASKIGTANIKLPILSNPLVGSVYLAEQNANPFGSLVAMYIVAEEPMSGVLVKLPGEVSLNQVTGQITSTFLNTPQAPAEEIELHFFGGERAPLATPARCGTYTTSASITPWSGNAAVNPTSSFEITSGPNGSPCPSPLPFTPSLTGGTTSIQAGGFSPFTMTMSREDGSQNLQSIQLHMPLGLSGTLSSVKLCGEEQADAGTCGPESLIGETVVSVGLGGDPFSVTGGKVYITGPYKGAPFGLSIVNPAKAGPYNLGQVVVRAKIEVNPETAALTITTDNEGPYKIPTIIDGIPLEIKHVNVDINRPGFTFNATNCSPLAITGSLTSTEGATSALSVPYQVTNCAVLAFKPKLEASTSGKTSRSDGASLHVKLGYPAGPYDANIARVKVELPKALPSRLTTLQKACTAQVFEANPAACPAASIVGHATATTPELPVPLTGPAYFVSHGGESFPSLIIVLQGYGVTVHLVGSTFINEKTGVTSSTFKTVPDAPVGSFELTLPTGPYSALGANKDLCKTKLAMPTEFVGQNGALIKTTTKIAVTGCGKVKKVSHKHKAKRAKRAAKRRAGRRR
jgi:hypothetical protein